MVRSSTVAGGDERLGPSRWSGLPRAGTLARLVLISLLLLTAAGALYTTRSGSGCPQPGLAGQPTTPPATIAPGDPAEPSAITTPSGPDHRLPVPAGSVGLPLRLADPAMLHVLRAGDRIDLLVLPPSGNGEPAVAPEVPAAGVLVLAVGGAALDDPVAGSGVLYLAMTPQAARTVSGLPEDSRFGVHVRP